MIVHRLTHAAQMTRDKDLSDLLTEAAELIENLQVWKIRWAEKDLAYVDLHDRYILLQARLHPSRIDSIVALKKQAEKEKKLADEADEKEQP